MCRDSVAFLQGRNRITIKSVALMGSKEGVTCDIFYVNIAIVLRV
jgi:hypothetical protein